MQIAILIFDRLTAREQLATFGSLYGANQAAADEMLELVGLATRLVGAGAWLTIVGNVRLV